MPIIRNTSTLNVKPNAASAVMVKPISVTTVEYAGYKDPATSTLWGNFVWGAKKWGESTSHSVGQKMPTISTEVQ